MAVTLIDSKSGSTIAVLFHECNRFGKLDAQLQARAIAAIRCGPHVAANAASGSR